MKRLLLSVTALLFTIALTAQQSVLLKMNPGKNKPYRLKSVTEQTVTQTVSGNPQTVESKVIYTLSLKVLDLIPDFMVAEVRFDTLITNTNTIHIQELKTILITGITSQPNSIMCIPWE